MALTVETGTVVAGADSYVTQAEADQYFVSKNNATWAAATPATKDASLREATQYLDAAYVWSGARLRFDQALSWPRLLYWDRDNRYYAPYTIPPLIKRAQMELALEALSGPLLTSWSRSKQIQSAAVGSLNVTYSPGNPMRMFQFVDLLLGDLIDGKRTGSIISADAVRG